MPPAEYLLRLQHGITGGFAPPTPNAVYSVSPSPDASRLSITAAVRPDGTPSLQDNLGPQSLTEGKKQEADSLVDELHTILKSIPTENPKGSQDIYGVDTSIEWRSDDFEWHNGGPQGCGGGNSSVKASEEDKAKFKRAVEIVEMLVKKADLNLYVKDA
ncbi:hypothetical protein C8R43DRAFT_166438 [Mycena crocata]|nr:hypothetical protein C8R43DRAFT_166438 [Mycena crocata]